MRAAPTSRAEWLVSLKSNIEPVGDCMEWQGKFRGTVPIHYTRKDYAWPGNCRASHSVRAILWALTNGRALPNGYLIRPACWNERCVDERHFVLLTRAEQVAEQSKRGEFGTASFRNARIRTGRKQSKLTPEIVASIRASSDTGPVEAKKHGVCVSTINQIRANRRWVTQHPGASIFSLGQALANFKG